MLERQNWSKPADYIKVGGRQKQAKAHGDGEVTSQGAEYDDRSDIEVITAKDAADMLRISQWMVYELVKRKDIPHVKIGRSVRFIRADLIYWMRCQSD